ncbi:hypothetical protein SAMN05216436_1225 [bacterium A37T11]|nr:hypothetical protein SAMN05216436_1225 [bacterium A37T11]
MSAPSFFFFLVFVIPLIGALIWLLSKDRKRGVVGLIVLAVLVILAITVSWFVASKSAMQNAKVNHEQAIEDEAAQKNN